MLLRRVMKHVRDQNWLAVGIDFLIVVTGVVIGIQVANWNAERVERFQEAEYVQRLAEDLRQDIKSYNAMLEIYTVKQETILALRDAPLATVMAGDPKEAALRLVRNSAFRAALADYYANSARLSEILAQPIGDYAHLLVGTIPGEIPIENLQRSDDATADRILSALEDLRANPAFEAAANAEIYYGRDISNNLRYFREQARDLLLILEDPMEKER